MFAFVYQPCFLQSFWSRVASVCSGLCSRCGALEETYPTHARSMEPPGCGVSQGRGREEHLMAEHLTSGTKGSRGQGAILVVLDARETKPSWGWQSVTAARFVQTVAAASSRKDPWEHEWTCLFVIWFVVNCQSIEQHSELEDKVAKGLSGNVDTMESFCLHCVSWKGNNGLFTANCLGGKKCHTWYCWSENNKWVW